MDSIDSYVQQACGNHLMLPSVSLQPHPNSPVQGIHSFRVDLARQDDRLVLRYSLVSSPATLRMPVPGPAIRQDGLWHHSCFELFVTDSVGPAYHEYNFSPSGAWAHYRFSDYHELISDDAEVSVPDIQVTQEGEVFSLNAVIDWPKHMTAFSLAAVIENSQGKLSYWANAHAADEPDFHHPDARCLNLA